VSRVLCDSGVWLAAANPVEQEPFHDSSRRLLLELGDRAEEIGALDLTLYEVANVATVSWRDPVAATELMSFIRDCAQDSLVRCVPELLESAVHEASRHGISVYDAAHVAAAQALGWTLVSTNVRDLVGRGLAVTPDQVVV